MPFVSEFSPLASLEAARPVFLMLMGISIVLISWRLTKKVTGWPPRILMAGAMLLALGYSVLLPLYEAGVLIRPAMLPYMPGADPVATMAWEVTKTISMNFGWLLFGLGLFLVSKSPLPARRPVQLTIVRP
ncbi:hypothetical protein [Haloferula sargassicola]|uniref:Uncharacterized protein n=1 Tax=Haloferula sargassicola TaxID=490096 RepID=A0ABP9URK7_9BACT